MFNRIWPTAVAGKADNVSSASTSACHIGGPNSVNPGQILLVYGTTNYDTVFQLSQAIDKDTINLNIYIEKRSVK